MHATASDRSFVVATSAAGVVLAGPDRSIAPTVKVRRCRSSRAGASESLWYSWRMCLGILCFIRHNWVSCLLLSVAGQTPSSREAYATSESGKTTVQRCRKVA